MPVNYYDQPAQAPIMNTYVPIDFANIYRVAAAQKAAIDKAVDDMNTAVSTFGEFRSPSSVDTQNYYNMTLGRMRDILDEYSNNPEAIKDASWRARLYGRLNNLDYAGLSQLREGADQLRTRMSNIAKMQASGEYNENWDDIDVSNYNTLQNGVLKELAPTPYMNANQLSNAYFDNMRQGTIGTTWQDGVRYTMTGNTMDDLYAVADAHMNDLISTPQGRMYMRDFMRANGGDAEAARSQFRDMIVASQIDRTRRPTLTVDPAWLASMKASGAGSTTTTTTQPTRLDLINNGLNNRYDQNFTRRYSSLSEDEQQRIQSNNQRYSKAYTDAINAYRANPTQENLEAVAKADNELKTFQYGQINMANREAALDAFRQHSGGPSDKAKFDAQRGDEEEGYSRSRYKYGVQAGLDAVSAPIDINQNDRLLTQVGGVWDVSSNDYGVPEATFGFSNSGGFLLPETVFQGITGVAGRDQNRANVGVISPRSTRLNFQPLFEGGLLTNLKFDPDNQVVRTGDGQLAIKGTVRVPVDEVNDKVGEGTIGTGWGLIGRERTKRALNQLYGVTITTQKVGDDDVDYYTFTAYRLLAPENGIAQESNVAVDQTWMNTNTYGGIGTGTLTTNNYPNSVNRALNTDR